MAPRCRDVRGAEAMDQGDRQIAEGGQNLWGEAFAQAGAIFLEADLAHRMGAILVARQEGSLPPARLQNEVGYRRGTIRGSHGPFSLPPSHTGLDPFGVIRLSSPCFRNDAVEVPA